MGRKFCFLPFLIYYSIIAFSLAPKSAFSITPFIRSAPVPYRYIGTIVPE